MNDRDEIILTSFLVEEKNPLERELAELATLFGDMGWILEIRGQEILHRENESDEEEKSIDSLMIIVRQFRTSFEAVYLLSKVMEELTFPPQITKEEAAIRDTERKPITFRGVPIQMVMFYEMPMNPGVVVSASTHAPVEGWNPAMLWEITDEETHERWLQGPEEMMLFPGMFNFEDPGEDPGGLQS